MEKEKRKAKQTVAMETNITSVKDQIDSSCDSHMTSKSHDNQMTQENEVTTPNMEAGMLLAKVMATAANKAQPEDIFEDSDEYNSD